MTDTTETLTPEQRARQVLTEWFSQRLDVITGAMMTALAAQFRAAERSATLRERQRCKAIGATLAEAFAVAVEEGCPHA